MRKGFDFIGNCIVFVCYDKDGNILMQKRSQNARDEKGTWDCGGGGVKVHETILQTLENEIKEEYCAIILDYEFLGYRDVHREMNGEKTHWIALDFKVLVDRDSVKNGEPHKFDEIGWFDIDELPTPLHSQLHYTIDMYKQSLKK